jgi:hypothetical protein
MNTKQAGYELGLFHGALKHGVDPLQAESINATDERLEGYFRKQAHTKTMDAAWTLLARKGKGQTKVAKLLAALTRFDRDHSPEVKQASDLVFDTIASFEKRAGGNAITQLLGAGAELTGGAAGLTAALGGSALGGLYWLGKRDSSEEVAENQAKKNKIKYYNDLSQELERRLKTKYDNEEMYSE